MKKNLWVNFVLIVLIIGLSLYVILTKNIVLGLDLSGGSRLVFEAETQNLNSDTKEKALSSLKDVIERRVNFFGVSESNVQTSGFEGKDRIIVELPGVEDVDQAVSLIGQTAMLSFVLIDDSANIYTPTDLGGADLKSADVVFDRNTGKPSVSIVFTDEGAEKFEKITAENINKPLAIFLDQNIVSAPVIQEKISGGQAQISGQFSLEEAKELEAQLNAGALPVPVKLIEEKTIGATLGEGSIEKSVKAGIVGIVMVVLFMVLIYRVNGIIASFALLSFAVITLAIYKLVPIVLTLPGIAGFLLSVGMAVDSNILIFERLKEEIKSRNISDALEVSFGKAWESIRDANIATLATSFILANPFDWEFLHTSGPVRGFAITLALGVGVSLFTGIFISRNLMRFFLIKKGVSN